MLQLLISTEPRALRQAVLQRVRDNQERNCPGQILIVPEQFSHEAERMLCEIGGDTISRYAEVLSFTPAGPPSICLLWGCQPSPDG